MARSEKRENFEQTPAGIQLGDDSSNKDKKERKSNGWNATGDKEIETVRQESEAGRQAEQDPQEDCQDRRETNKDFINIHEREKKEKLKLHRRGREI